MGGKGGGSVNTQLLGDHLSRGLGLDPDAERAKAAAAAAAANAPDVGALQAQIDAQKNTASPSGAGTGAGATDTVDNTGGSGVTVNQNTGATLGGSVLSPPSYWYKPGGMTPTTLKSKSSGQTTAT